MWVALEEVVIDLHKLRKCLLIVVDTDNHLAAALGEGAVAGVGHPLSHLHKATHTHLGVSSDKLVNHRRGIIARVIIDHHKFPQALIESLCGKRAQRAAQWLGTVVGGDDDRHLRGIILSHNNQQLCRLQKWCYSANNPSISSHVQSLGAGSKPRIWQTMR